jgi:hypothetical protein
MKTVEIKIQPGEDVTIIVTHAKPTTRLLPFDLSISNPIILDNDFPNDSPCRWLLYLLADRGKADMGMNIITKNPDPKNPRSKTDPYWGAERKAAEGMNVLSPTWGDDVRALKLICDEIMKCTPEKPLIYLAGGQCTTIAKVLELYPGTRDRVVIFHTNGIYNYTANRVQSYNTQDFKSAMYCVNFGIYVNCNFKDVPAHWYTGKNLGLTKVMIDSIPPHAMVSLLKTWYATLFEREGMADATPLLWLLNSAVWTKVERRYPGYYFISGHDWTLYGPTLVEGFKMALR